MKKTISISILMLIIFSTNAQIVNRFRDSTWFKKGVQFDKEFTMTKDAEQGKVLVSEANGLAKWKDLRKVDTIYKNGSNDSIVYLINGIRYAIKESIGSGTPANITAVNGLMKSNDTTISLGGELTQPTNIIVNENSPFFISDNGFPNQQTADNFIVYLMGVPPGTTEKSIRLTGKIGNINVVSEVIVDTLNRRVSNGKAGLNFNKLEAISDFIFCDSLNLYSEIQATNLNTNSYLRRVMSLSEGFKITTVGYTGTVFNVKDTFSINSNGNIEIVTNTDNTAIKILGKDNNGYLVWKDDIYGQATLTAGTVTIANTNIQNTSIIVCTANGILNSGFVSVTKNAGVGFTIQSSNILDGRTVDYMIKY